MAGLMVPSLQQDFRKPTPMTINPKKKKLALWKCIRESDQRLESLRRGQKLLPTAQAQQDTARAETDKKREAERVKLKAIRKSTFVASEPPEKIRRKIQVWEAEKYTEKIMHDMLQQLACQQGCDLCVKDTTGGTNSMLRAYPQNLPVLDVGVAPTVLSPDDNSPAGSKKPGWDLRRQSQRTGGVGITRAQSWKLTHADQLSPENSPSASPTPTQRDIGKSPSPQRSASPEPKKPGGFSITVTHSDALDGVIDDHNNHKTATKQAEEAEVAASRKKMNIGSAWSRLRSNVVAAGDSPSPPPPGGASPSPPPPSTASPSVSSPSPSAFGQRNPVPGTRYTSLQVEDLVQMERRNSVIKRVVTPQERAVIKAAFDAFDKDGSGSIDATELKSLSAELGEPMSDMECAAAVQLMDQDQNGSIDFQEFCDWWSTEGGGGMQLAKMDRIKKRLTSKNPYGVRAPRLNSLSSSESVVSNDDGSPKVFRTRRSAVVFGTLDNVTTNLSRAHVSFNVAADPDDSRPSTSPYGSGSEALDASTSSTGTRDRRTSSTSGGPLNLMSLVKQAQKNAPIVRGYRDEVFHVHEYQSFLPTRPGFISPSFEIGPPLNSDFKFYAARSDRDTPHKTKRPMSRNAAFAADQDKIDKISDVAQRQMDFISRNEEYLKCTNIRPQTKMNMFGKSMGHNMQNAAAVFKKLSTRLYDDVAEDDLFDYVANLQLKACEHSKEYDGIAVFVAGKQQLLNGINKKFQEHEEPRLRHLPEVFEAKRQRLQRDHCVSHEHVNAHDDHCRLKACPYRPPSTVPFKSSFEFRK
eukprot:gnl/Hemi2/17956_TR5927_c0_g1_i1.p1 gnl/Hemi2/17956_TR5927_c0_g1~~gnl/Hemi2/17956_TR5927_c0_g1_i1.p1  ORF type:complete len:806 (+),score=236.45 gnl/Hemi2/17956_TR5927_c0_g1_i1:146-2563(+)